MPIPTSFSESALQAFMIVELGDTATVLGWVPGTPRVEYAVYAAARLLDVTDVATATDMAALEAVACLSIWRAALGALAPAYDENIEGQSLKRSQLFDHAQKMIAYYEAACARLGITTASGGGIVRSHPVKQTQDPYALPAASGAEF